MTFIETTPKRRRAWPIAVGIIVVLIVALVVAAVIADGIVRGLAEKAVATAVADKLPGTSVDDIDVEIGGGAFIPQYASGTFDSVHIVADGIDADGAPIDLDLTAKDVPSDTSKKMGAVTGTATLDQKAVSTLVASSGADAAVTLGDGTVDYDVARTILGIPLTFTVTAEPSTDGKSIIFTPKSAAVTAGNTTFATPGIIDDIIAKGALSACVADQLPAGLTITGVKVDSKMAVVSFTGDGLAISAIASKGSCS